MAGPPRLMVFLSRSRPPRAVMCPAAAFKPAGRGQPPRDFSSTLRVGPDQHHRAGPPSLVSASRQGRPTHGRSKLGPADVPGYTMFGVVRGPDHRACLVGEFGQPTPSLLDLVENSFRPRFPCGGAGFHPGPAFSRIGPEVVSASVNRGPSVPWFSCLDGPTAPLWPSMGPGCMPLVVKRPGHAGCGPVKTPVPRSGGPSAVLWTTVVPLSQACLQASFALDGRCFEEAWTQRPWFTRLIEVFPIAEGQSLEPFSKPRDSQATTPMVAAFLLLRRTS